MKAITKLTLAALGAASLAGGVALAQNAQPGSQSGAQGQPINPETANYGTPAGAPLKRDGSLSADSPPPANAGAGSTNSSTSGNSSAGSMAGGSTSSSSTSTNADTGAMPSSSGSSSSSDTGAGSSASSSSASDSGAGSDASLQPRADRN